MMNERELRGHLATIFMHLKEQQAAQTQLQNHLASLRDVLKEASPNFSRAFSERLEYWQHQTSALDADSAAGFDAIIAKLTSS
jgi:hypothetical protein